MKKKTKLLAVLIGCFFISLSQAFSHPQDDPRVKRIYEQFDNHLLWIEEGNWTPCARTFFEVLTHVEDHGLWPENYIPLLKKLDTMDLSTFKAQEEADAALTLLALTYIAEIRGKRLNPHAVDKTIFAKPEPIDEVEILKEYLSPPHVCGWAAHLAPTNEEYTELQGILAHYRKKKEQGGWPTLPPNTHLEKGDKGPLVKTLKTQLIAQDVLAPENQRGDVFDETVFTAVKLYQKLHGLERDGKVGGETLKALNTPVEDRIESIIVSLERHRWLPSPLPPRYILVNIPGFYLKAVNPTDSFTMPIITGREYRKTPVFHAPLTGIVFNPSWTVPPNIAVKDKLPLLRKNPHALSAKGYRFYGASGEPLNPHSINWDLYSSQHFPIKIVQSPGNANALGKIRFTIENSFAIYLHGTSEKKLFQKTKRALSSGCIRVQDPEKLAEFVLDDPKTWPLAKIQTASSGTTTKSVNLKKPLPVFITYCTVFKEGPHWYIVPDNYKQDVKILSALEKTKQERED